MKKAALLIAFLFACLTAQASQKNINYTDSGKGKPLVLIHPFPTDERLWAMQRKELQQFFRVITIDLRGFGKAAPVDGKAVTMTDYAEDVRKLLDKLEIRQAVIGGESMGGYVALAFLKKYPERTIGLILSDTQSIADNDETKTRREASAEDVLQNGTAKFTANFMTKALSEDASDEAVNYLREIVNSQTPAAIASALRGMALRTDTSDVLAASKIPVLIITGDQDTVILPEQSEKMHKLAKLSTMVTIANAGHLSSLEQPAEWNKVVIFRFSDNVGA